MKGMECMRMMDGRATKSNIKFGVICVIGNASGVVCWIADQACFLHWRIQLLWPQDTFTHTHTLIYSCWCCKLLINVSYDSYQLQHIYTYSHYFYGIVIVHCIYRGKTKNEEEKYLHGPIVDLLFMFNRTKKIFYLSWW